MYLTDIYTVTANLAGIPACLCLAASRGESSGRAADSRQPVPRVRYSAAGRAYEEAFPVASPPLKVPD